MCGSSLDGVDLALCRFERSVAGDWSYKIIRAATHPYPEEWREKLKAIHLQSALYLAEQHAQFGRFLGEVISAFLGRERPDVVSVHGHTVFHRPGQGFTWQLGSGEAMAAVLDVPVVADIRQRDVSLGGQGAPLVPLGERYLFPGLELFLNLGGIVNLSAPDVAFDICIGNQALNELAMEVGKPFDDNGRLAAKGAVLNDLLDALNALSWNHLPAPKSLDQGFFEDAVCPVLQKSSGKIEDRLATYVEYVAIQVERSVRRYVEGNQRMLVTGGGARNYYLLERIGKHLEKVGVSVVDSDSSEIIDFKEAMVFAFLGLQTLLGNVNCDHKLTGAIHSSVGGSLHLPSHRRMD